MGYLTDILTDGFAINLFVSSEHDFATKFFDNSRSIGYHSGSREHHTTSFVGHDLHGKTSFLGLTTDAYTKKHTHTTSFVARFVPCADGYKCVAASTKVPFQYRKYFAQLRDLLKSSEKIEKTTFRHKFVQGGSAVLKKGQGIHDQVFEEGCPVEGYLDGRGCKPFLHSNPVRNEKQCRECVAYTTDGYDTSICPEGGCFCIRRTSPRVMRVSDLGDQAAGSDDRLANLQVEYHPHSDFHKTSAPAKLNSSKPYYVIRRPEVLQKNFLAGIPREDFAEISFTLSMKGDEPLQQVEQSDLMSSLPPALEAMGRELDVAKNVMEGLTTTLEGLGFNMATGDSPESCTALKEREESLHAIAQAMRFLAMTQSSCVKLAREVMGVQIKNAKELDRLEKYTDTLSCFTNDRFDKPWYPLLMQIRNGLTRCFATGHTAPTKKTEMATDIIRDFHIEEF